VVARLSVVVDSRLRFELAEARSVLGEDELRNLIRSFEHKNPQHQKLRAMGFYPKNEPMILKTWEKDAKFLTLPRGGTDRLRAAVARVGAKVRFLDRRFGGKAIAEEDGIPDHKIKLWEHQATALDALIQRESCILRSPTGSGKSSTVIGLIARLKVRTIVIVWTGGLFAQWLERCCLELGLEKDQIGSIRGAKRRWKLKPITIAMQQTLAKHGVDEDLRSTFGCVILDEMQRTPARTVTAAIDPWPARYRIGVSASEKRRDGKECISFDLFGGGKEEDDARVVNIKTRALEEKGIILPVEVRAIPTRFEAPWWRTSEFMSADTGDSHDYGRLLDEMSIDDARNDLVIRFVRQEVDDDAQMIVFTLRRAHVHELDRLVNASKIKSGMLLGGGEWAKVFAETVAKIRGNELRAAVGTVQAVGVGQDFPSVEAGILALPLGNNPHLFRQIRGRICRSAAGKRRARLYVLCDLAVFGKAQLRQLNNWNDGNVVVLRDDAWVSVRDFLERRPALRLNPVG
jgi:superfamily II DNA or RNA helicase